MPHLCQLSTIWHNYFIFDVISSSFGTIAGCFGTIVDSCLCPKQEGVRCARVYEWSRLARRRSAMMSDLNWG